MDCLPSIAIVVPEVTAVITRALLETVAETIVLPLLISVLKALKISVAD